MNKNKIDILLQRSILVDTHFENAENDKATDIELSNIEKKLDIILAEDFKYICKHHLYENFTDFYSVCGEENHSIIGETLFLRKEKNLPHRFIYLASDGTSSYFMETKYNREEPSPIHWIHWEEEERFCKEESLEQDYDYFPSFTDFFENLIERKEEGTREEQEYEESRHDD